MAQFFSFTPPSSSAQVISVPGEAAAARVTRAATSTMASGPSSKVLAPGRCGALCPPTVRRDAPLQSALASQRAGAFAALFLSRVGIPRNSYVGALVGRPLEDGCAPWHECFVGKLLHRHWHEC